MTTEDARATVTAIVASLRAAAVPTETRVASLRTRFGRTRLRAVGRLWRLGALCVDEDGGLWATGRVIVVTPPTHPNHRSNLALERNELRRALVRAGVPAGATVVLDAVLLDLDAPEPPLVVGPDGLAVAWAAGGGAIPLERYLGERAALLIHPLPGSTD